MAIKRKKQHKIVKSKISKEIFIKGAKANNLKNIDLAIPRNQLVVVTGVSGSGKSSLTMDTLFAEGQRRYVESLSSYARQFLMRMKKPDVDFIKGICPAIAIEQKVSTSNARSTVGTLTEIYDYFRLLFARIGKTYSPISGQLVTKHEVSNVVDYINSQENGARIQLLIPFVLPEGREIKKQLDLLLQKGFTRLQVAGKLQRIEDLLEKPPTKKKLTASFILIDRFVINDEDEENIKRIADSVNTAFYESGGSCTIEVIDKETVVFNNRFELDGMEFPEPTHQLFNFNNPFGACPKCEGFGSVVGIDEERVVPNKMLSVYDDAVAAWKGEKGKRYKEAFITKAAQKDFPIHRPYEELTEEQKVLLWEGAKGIRGIDYFFQKLEEKLYKIQNRVMLARYRGKTKCPECRGRRLNKFASYVKIEGKTIGDLVEMPISDLLDWFNNLKLSEFDQEIAKRVLLEVKNRLRFMEEVGLSYLNINRLSNSLSGGETQRINLTRTLGSNLTSSLYILDEPSIGLHPRDTGRLVNVLKSLRDLGNTVVVVEHEEDMIANADYLIDIGPKAGIHGGNVVFAGPYSEIHNLASDTLTANYMSGRMKIPLPERRRKVVNKITIQKASQHNLKGVTVDFPLNTLTVVTGVSGSGKTTLVKQILYPAMKRLLGEGSPIKPGAHLDIVGDLSQITTIEFINQRPIGKSSRSNPVTYVKAFDTIRNLFSKQQLSLIRGFKPKHFSFNVEGGRCETCKGEGETVVEMQFLADVRLECEECGGKRFRSEVLDVHYRGKNIFEVLDLSVEEALAFFEGSRDVYKRLKPLDDVGLGYVKLGQSSSTLSGGEAQRVKLASYLGKEKSTEKILFIFDEPTTGLHFHDIRNLLAALQALVEKGHSVVVVEHNMEIIKSADWVIDLGPEGGDDGGFLVSAGPPEKVARSKKSYTGKFLAAKLKE